MTPSSRIGRFVITKYSGINFCAVSGSCTISRILSRTKSANVAFASSLTAMSL